MGHLSRLNMGRTCFFMVLCAITILPATAWDFWTTTYNFEGKAIVSALNQELTALDTALGELDKQFAPISERKVTETKTNLKAIVREFDYIMKKEYVIFGDRPAHPNRAYIENFERDLDAIPIMDVYVTWFNTQSVQIHRSIAAILTDVQGVELQFASLGAHSDFTAAMTRISAIKDSIVQMGRTLDAALRKLETDYQAAHGKSQIQSRIQYLEGRYLKKMTVKYPEKKDDVKHIARYKDSMKRATAALGNLASMYYRFTPRGVYPSASKAINLAVNAMASVADFRQVAETSKEDCLDSEAFRKFIIDEDLAPKVDNDPYWVALKENCEARQEALEGLRENNEMARRAYENPESIRAEENVARVNAARKGLVDLATGWLNKVAEITRNFRDVATPASWRQISTSMTKATESFNADSRALEAFASGEDFDTEDKNAIHRAQTQLGLGAALNNVYSLYNEWFTRNFALEKTAVSTFHTKWTNWLAAQGRTKPEDLKRGLQQMRSEAVKLASTLLVMLPSASKGAVIAQLQAFDESTFVNVETSIATPSALIAKYKHVIKQSDAHLDALPGGFIWGSYRSRRIAYIESHTAKMDAVKKALKDMEPLATALGDSRTLVNNNLVTAALSTLSDEALSNIINPPSPVRVNRAPFRPIWEEPDHEALTMKCFRGLFFTALKAASKDPDFIDCTMLMSNVSPNVMKVSLAEFDSSFDAKVQAARSSDQLFQAFADAHNAGAYVSLKAFTDKAASLAIRDGFFGPTSTKMARLIQKKFNPGSYYPYNNQDLIHEMARSGRTLPERRLSTLQAGVSALSRRYLAERGSAEAIVSRRMPVLVRWRGEEGIDAGGLRAEFFSTLAEALMMPEGSLVVSTENNDRVVFAPAASGDRLKDQRKKARLLGFVMGWAYFNKVALALKLPLVYYHYLRQKIRAHVNNPRPLYSFADEAVDYSRFMLMDFQGVANFRQSVLTTSAFFLDKESPAAQQHMQLFCANTFLFSGDIDDNLPKSEILETATTSVQGAIIAAAKNTIHDTVFRKSLQLVNDWADSFINLFTDEELPILANLRVDELQAVFGAYADIKVDVLKEKVGVYTDGSADRVASTRRLSGTKTMKAFWKMMESFTPHQRKLTVEFWTGQSNLPDGLEFNKWNIFLHEERDGWKFPQAHTCFNNMELFHCPANKNEEECVKLLTQAFSNAWTTIGRFDIR